MLPVLLSPDGRPYHRNGAVVLGDCPDCGCGESGGHCCDGARPYSFAAITPSLNHRLVIQASGTATYSSTLTAVGAAGGGGGGTLVETVNGSVPFASSQVASVFTPAVAQCGTITNAIDFGGASYFASGALSLQTPSSPFGAGFLQLGRYQYLDASFLTTFPLQSRMQVFFTASRVRNPGGVGQVNDFVGVSCQAQWGALGVCPTLGTFATSNQTPVIAQREVLAPGGVPPASGSYALGAGPGGSVSYFNNAGIGDGVDGTFGTSVQFSGGVTGTSGDSFASIGCDYTQTTDIYRTVGGIDGERQVVTTSVSCDFTAFIEDTSGGTFSTLSRCPEYDLIQEQNCVERALDCCDGPGDPCGRLDPSQPILGTMENLATLAPHIALAIPPIPGENDTLVVAVKAPNAGAGEFVSPAVNASDPCLPATLGSGAQGATDEAYLVGEDDLGVFYLAGVERVRISSPAGAPSTERIRGLWEFWTDGVKQRSIPGQPASMSIRAAIGFTFDKSAAPGSQFVIDNTLTSLVGPGVGSPSAGSVNTDNAWDGTVALRMGADGGPGPCVQSVGVAADQFVTSGGRVTDSSGGDEPRFRCQPVIRVGYTNVAECSSAARSGGCAGCRDELGLEAL